MILETKNAKVRRLVAAREYKQALQICKDWDKGISPLYREQLRLGYECLVHPSFYQQLGINTESEYLKAVEILHKLYGGNVIE